jgi:hypothetical protein
LALPTDWTMADLSEATERQVGKPVIWLPLPEGFPPGLCGLLFDHGDDIVALHRRAESPERWRRTMVHVAAHLLLGHHRERAVSVSTAANMLTGTSAHELAVGSGPDPTGFRKVEAEAEALTALILDRPMHGGRRGGSAGCTKRGVFGIPAAG